ncbi:MAG: eukaryotic-like serine/threonine-protein kinase [Solirubrobacteraceae bacterium]|nr:eukaryotic-like serine/threonine-protein kinase [Solirubrobacteraceae bacterium]
MATVVLAEDTLLGREVALKRLTGAGDPRGLSRLRREALVGASVSHPNLVSIFDVVADADGDVIIVMEYVRGETLREALSGHGKLAVPEALRVLEGVAAGLDTIHARGIVHRDVKPANILLGTDGSIKVADLGIALVPDRTRITTAGAVLGTFSYMAPEQLEDAPSRPGIDIYALAAVAYEVLSGRKARDEPNPVALAHAISTQPPPDLREVWPAAPAAAAELLIRGMSRDPGDRPRSAGELIDRLRAALEPRDTAPVMPAPSARERPHAAAVPPPASRPERAPAPNRSDRARPPVVSATRSSQPRRWPAVAALLALIVVAVVVALLLNTGGSQPPTRVAGHAGRRSGATPTGSHAATPTTPRAPAAGTPAPTTASGPVSAVKSFYSLAASHRYAEAWALADPTFRQQLGSYPSFQGQQAGDISIRFDAAQTVSQSSSAATVSVKTTSVRTDGTTHCAGTVDLRPGASSGQWLLHLIHISCA